MEREITGDFDSAISFKSRRSLSNDENAGAVTALVSVKPKPMRLSLCVTKVSLLLKSFN
jgi:hypothetical protein